MTDRRKDVQTFHNYKAAVLLNCKRRKMSFIVGWVGLEDNDNNLERCHQNLTTTLKNCSGNWGNLWAESNQPAADHLYFPNPSNHLNYEIKKLLVKDRLISWLLCKLIIFVCWVFCCPPVKNGMIPNLAMGRITTEV